MSRPRKENTAVDVKTETTKVNRIEHTEQKTFLCKWCKKTFLSAEELLKHSIICEQNKD